MKSQFMNGCLIFAFCLLLPFQYLLSQTTTADLVLINGKIITVDDLNTIAQAVAVKDSIILKVGTNADIQPHIQNGVTQILNLNGLTVTPGIIDAHTHIMFYGISENEYVNLRGTDTKTVEDVVAKIGARVPEVQPGEWIMGDGFFKLERMVTRYDLDPVSPDNPVFMQSLGGHYGSCNSKALEIAGVDANTEDPEGGIIERDPQTGEPNGVLWNHPAMDVVRRFFPAPDEAAMTRDVLWAQDHYMAVGYTSFQDVNVRGVSRVRAYADAKDSLKMRGYILFTIERMEDAKVSVENLVLTKDPWLSFIGDKFLVDGQPPTSYTYQPHLGPSYDMPAWNPDSMKQVVKDLHRAGHQLAFHVMGDAAIDLALDAIEEALNETPRPDHRHRLEHVFIPTEAAIQRMKDLGVVVSLQPAAIYTGGDFYTQLWGNEVIQRLMPLRSFLDAGIPVALGTDWPTVIVLHPKYTLWSSIVRRTLTGAVIAPEESITITEALRAHTMGSAYAAFEEDVKGSIEEGKYADMTIWSDDIYSIPTEKIPELYVQSVIVAGTVYENPHVHVENEEASTQPDNMMLFYNYPNPFNASTQIMYTLDNAGQISLKIYNERGQLVKSLVNGRQLPGRYIITWDGTDMNGREVTSGMYYFQLSQGDQIEVKKAILMK